MKDHEGKILDFDFELDDAEYLLKLQNQYTVLMGQTPYPRSVSRLVYWIEVMNKENVQVYDDAAYEMAPILKSLRGSGLV